MARTAILGCLPTKKKLQMTEIHPEFGKLMTAEEYAREWEENSDHFDRLGYYTMPLERLGGPKTVLEVGCGSGRSTLALARKGHAVIAAEVNETAAQNACEYLVRNGIAAGIGHEFPARLHDAPQVTIVVGDVHAEGAARAMEGVKFDAVLCWFIGAQLDVIADFFGKPRLELSSDDVRRYRLSVQAKCYALGRHVLRGNGMVQIVDRMRLASWQDKDAARENLAKMQADIAGPEFRVSKASTFLARVSGGFEGSAIQYLTESPGAQVRVVTSVVGTRVGRED